MVRPERLSGALSALNMILVLVRKMAFERRPYDDIAAVLDAAEELPTLLAQPADLTDYFRQVLLDLAARDAEFNAAVLRFDNSI